MSKHTELPKEVREHEARVGLLSRLAARASGKDERAAYLAGVFHDDGKALLPPELFSGREITTEEYESIKGHSVYGMKEHLGRMKRTSLCAGLHHEMGADGGYGISIKDLPEDLSFYDLKKVLDIATIVAIADFIDAYMTRSTSVGLAAPKRPLEEMLNAKYPAESVLVGIMLGLKDKLYNKKEEPNECC